MWRMFLGLVPLIVVGKQDPTLGADGVLHAHHANSLYAVNTDGSTEWIFDAGAPLGAHAEGLEGTVYVTTATAGTSRTDPDTLFALDSLDGSIKWKHQVDENAVVDGSLYRHHGNPLAVATDGTIYLVSFVNYTVGGGGVPPSCNSTTIDAIDTNGTLRWTSSMAGCGKLSLVGADGTLFAMKTKSIDALQHDTGKVKWSVALDQCFPEATVSFAEDGSVFLLHSEQNCSSLVLSRLSSEDGRFLWKVPLTEWSQENGPSQLSRFMKLGSKKELYINGMTLNGTCSLLVFDFDGIPLRNLPCLKGDTYYGDEEDVFVTVYNSHGGGDEVSHVWEQSGTDGHLLWNTSFHNEMQMVGHAMRFGHDGTVFAWGEEGYGVRYKSQTHAFRKGDTLWSVDTRAVGSILLLLMSADGTTYVQGLTSSGEIEIVAVAVDGVEKWRYQPTEALAEFV